MHIDLFLTVFFILFSFSVNTHLLKLLRMPAWVTAISSDTFAFSLGYSHLPSQEKVKDSCLMEAEVAGSGRLIDFCLAYRANCIFQTAPGVLQTGHFLIAQLHCYISGTLSLDISTEL